jgi:protein O-GlcNAc transferase
VLAALSAAHFGLKQYSAAQDAARQAVEADPNLARAHYNLGRVYQQEGRNEDALAAYQEATRLDAQDGQAFMRLGEVYDRMKQPAEAEAAYKRAGALQVH